MTEKIQLKNRSNQSHHYFCVCCFDEKEEESSSSSFYKCSSKLICKDCVIRHYSLPYNTNLMRIDRCIICGEEYTDSEIKAIKKVLFECKNNTTTDLDILFEVKIQEKKDFSKKNKNNKTPEAVRIEKKELPLFKQKIQCLKESIETPCCGGYFTDFDGCLAIRCGLCESSYFCGVCYEVINNKKDPHDHIRKGECVYYNITDNNNNNVFGSENTVKEYMRKRRIYSVLKAVVFFKEEEENCSSLDDKKEIVLEIFEEEKKVFLNLFSLFDNINDLEGIDFRKLFKRKIYDSTDEIYHCNNIKEKDSYSYLKEGKIPPKKVFEKSRVVGFEEMYC